MDISDAAAKTTEALQSALETARSEREDVANRLATLDRLIEDLGNSLDSVEAGAAQAQPAARRAARTATTKKATRKAAKRGRKATTRKTTTAKKAGGAARKRQEMSRTDRVVSIVRSAGAPMSTGEVRAKLMEDEPRVSSKVTSAALAYAQKRGHVTKTNDGKWAEA